MYLDHTYSFSLPMYIYVMCMHVCTYVQMYGCMHVKSGCMCTWVGCTSPVHTCMWKPKVDTRSLLDHTPSYITETRSLAECGAHDFS